MRAIARTIQQSGGGQSLWARKCAAVVIATALIAALTCPRSLAAQTFTVIHSFTGSPDGFGPAAGLTRGPDGGFLGTTESGGIFGEGTVFKINREGRVRLVYSFCQLASCADGAVPFGSVISDDSGTIYGTTYSADLFLYGTVFKIDPAATKPFFTRLADQPRGTGRILGERCSATRKAICMGPRKAAVYCAARPVMAVGQSSELTQPATRLSSTASAGAAMEESRERA
jgi:hypothetical protein